MKQKNITIFSLLLLYSLNSFSQISLSEEREQKERFLRGAQEQQYQQYNNNQNSERRSKNILEAPNDKKYQEAKFANLSQLLLLTAALTGYGEACKMPEEKIVLIENFVFYKYAIKEKNSIDKYKEKKKEFATSKPNFDECKVFSKEFEIVADSISKVKDSKTN
jgi:hypothetical protein